MPESGMPTLRSLADDLRQRSVEALAQTLSARPDLLNPIPMDIRELALRAGSAHSVSMALDRLNSLELAILEVASALGSPCPDNDVVRALLGTRSGAVPTGTSPEHIHNASGSQGPSKSATNVDDLESSILEAMQRLRSLALIWGRDEVNVVRAAVESFGTYPCGLYPPLAQHLPAYRQWLGNTSDVVAAVESCSVAAQDCVKRLVWDGPTEDVPHATRAKDAKGNPWGELIRMHLLHVVNESTVALPREVALTLRGGAWVRPERIMQSHSPTKLPWSQSTDMEGASALLAVRRIAEVVETIQNFHPKIARAGQIRKADLVTLAGHISLSEDDAFMCIVLALASGLIGIGGDSDDSLAITGRGVAWLSYEPDEQWWLLAQSLLEDAGAALTAVNHRIIDRARIPSHEVDSGYVLMQEWIKFLAGGNGASEFNGSDFSLHRPRLASHYPSESAHCAALCALIGIDATLGHSRLASLLISSNQDAARAFLRDALPPEVTQFLVQSDHSIVVPGRPSTAVRAELLLLSDQISRDHALVLRISPGKIRARIAAGSTAAEILDFLTSHSPEPLPQSLVYLVNDCARPRSAIKVESPTTVVTTATKEEALNLESSAMFKALGLRKIDDHTFVSPSEPMAILNALQEQGFSVDATSLDDASLKVRQPEFASRTWGQRGSMPTPTAVARALTSMNLTADSSETSAFLPDPTWTEASATNLRTMLTDAASTGLSMYLELADADGNSRVMHVSPIHTDAGFTIVYDVEARKVTTISLSRVLRVAVDS